MNKNIFKYIILGVIGIIVLVLSILGFSKYSKNHSIDINLGIGNHGIGSDNKNGGGTGGGIDFGGNKSKTKKGNFIKCIAYEDSLKATGYFEFRNGTLYNIMQYEISGEAPSDYMKKHTKKDVEDELKSMLCYKESACKNVKISWSGNTITMTLGVDINVVSSSIFEVGMSESEFLSEMSKDKGTTCEKVSKAPIYATETDSSKVYTNSSEKKYNDSLSNGTQSTEVKSTNESNKTESNEREEICFQLATGNYDDKRSESVNYSFYCSKNVIKKNVRVNIVGQYGKDKSAKYTAESYKNYLKKNFCDKYHLSNCKYVEITGNTKEIEMQAECNTNYAGLSKTTGEQLTLKGDSLEESLEKICEQ